MASYLKALGVLRLVGEQADPAAIARWDEHGYVLRSAFDEAGLEDFFLHRYRPTPIVSPWNKSSGFGPEGAGELQAIEGSTDERLESYRHAIAAARCILGRTACKTEIVRACRSDLPDECVAWIDAAVVLTPSGAAYPPLLGTGGNVGRLELSRNFHRRILEALAMTAKTGRQAKAAKKAEEWLADALWDLGASTGVKESSGQFDPGSAGGTNSAPGGRAPAILNPWDYVLMIEGLMLFAAGSARRLGVDTAGRGAAPFTSDGTCVGYAGAAPDEAVKGEVWLPLWERFTRLSELRRLMAEARVDWRGRHARSGLEFAKAASTLGVDRGIAAFSRFVLAERFGQAIVAVPADRVEVVDDDTRRAAAVMTPPLAELDGWLDRVRRRSNPPAGVARALRRVDAAAFEVTRGTPGALARVLIEAAALEDAVANARTFRERSNLRPLWGLSARRWAPALLDDATETGLRGTRELRLAMAFASAHDRSADARTVTSLRTILRPVRYSERNGVEWTGVSLVEGLRIRPAVSVIAAAHVRRVIDLLAARTSRRERQVSTEGSGAAGLRTRFTHGWDVEPSDLGALVVGELDEALFGELLAGCLLLDWRTPLGMRWRVPGGSARRRAIPPAFAVLGPFFAHQPIDLRVRDVGRLPREQASRSSEDRSMRQVADLRPEPEWIAQLAAGRPQPVLAAALRRLRIAGLAPVARNSSDFRLGPDQSIRLAAALLCPLSDRTGGRLLRRACPSENEQQPELTDEELDKSDEEETEEVD